MDALDRYEILDEPDEYWCYLQPIVAAFIKSAQEAFGKPETGLSTYNKIIGKALAEFADQYNLFEGKAPTEAEIAAARAELVAALQRVLGVGE